MRGLTIADFTDENVLSVDLIDILQLLGDDATRSRWRLCAVEAFAGEAGAEAATELDRLSDSDEWVSGERLQELAAAVSQIVEGDFQGFLDNEKPWIIIRAVDSSAYDVLTDDQEVLDRIRNQFADVTELPA